MGLRELLNEKISDETKQTPEYKLLLNFIKKAKINSTEELRHRTSAEIKQHKACLTKCSSQGSTKNRSRGKDAHKIEFFELIKQKILTKL